MSGETQSTNLTLIIFFYSAQIDTVALIEQSNQS